MLDLLAIGRVSVDLYGQEEGRGLADSQTFQKAVGGSPTNVAIGTARYGHKSAIVTAVGEDSLGKFIIKELKKFGVSCEFVATRAGGRTPIVVAGIADPDNPEFVFYRELAAPDTQIELTPALSTAGQKAKILWFTGSTLATDPLANTVKELLHVRSGETIFDLDYRPAFWSSRQVAQENISEALVYATTVIGNLEECSVATGLPIDSSPAEFARALLAKGAKLAIIKGGVSGVLVAHGNSSVSIPGIGVKTRCGLGAGDAFGAAVVHGLLSGWDLERTVRFANAAGAFVASQLMCSDAMPNESEVNQLLAVTI
jgi:5-dehydro-2-deoxygluconokinase